MKWTNLQRWKVVIPIILVIAGSVTAWASKELKAEDFFKHPEFSNAALSPDGSRLAYCQVLGETVRIVIQNFKTEKISIIEIGENEKNRISYLQWATPDRLIYQMERGSIFAANANGSKIKKLAAFKLNVSVYSVSIPEVYSLLPQDEDHIIIKVYDWVTFKDTFYKVNIYNGGRKIHFEDMINASSYLMDKGGEFRAGIQVSGGKIRVIYRERKGKNWKTLDKFIVDSDNLTFNYTYQGASKQYCELLSFDYDSKIIYIGFHNERDTMGIHALNLETGQIEETLAESEKYDLVGENTGLYFNRRLQKLIGFTFPTDRQTTIWLDPYFKQVQSLFDSSLKDNVNQIMDWSDDENVFLARSYSGNNPGMYYVLDLKNKSLKEVGARYPQLEPEILSPVLSFTIQARDGLTLHGYITVPQEAKGLYLPLIVYLHGGPWARDYFRYQSEVQYLAHHGYAVMQINFRGSTGYGFKHFDAARKDFGKGINNDVVDCVNWATENGLADPERIAVMGFSYGGYATMNALTSNPELFRCGVTMAGVYSLPLQMSDYISEHGNWFAYEYWKAMVGDPKKDSDKLKDISPINHIDRLQAPVFVYQGESDNIVSVAQARVLKNKLKKAGKEFEYHTMSSVGHGWWNYNGGYHDFEKQIETYEAILAFLDKHMKPGSGENRL